MSSPRGPRHLGSGSWDLVAPWNRPRGWASGAAGSSGGDVVGGDAACRHAACSVGRGILAILISFSPPLQKNIIMIAMVSNSKHQHLNNVHGQRAN
jgi:hypothetical protein